MPEKTLPSKPATDELLPPSLLAKLDRMELVSRKIFRGRMKGERRSVRKALSLLTFAITSRAMIYVLWIGTCTLVWISCS